MNEINESMLRTFKDYLIFDNIDYKVLFSTAEKNKNFNRHTDDGVATLNKICDEFDVKEVVYLKQVHSDRIIIYDGKNKEQVIEAEADAVITNVKNIAFGVFTADCVPILLVDESKNIGAAIHSGWKGTFSSITAKTIDKLKEQFNVNTKDIKAYIGPHIRNCCYEVSEELKYKFLDKKNIKEDILFTGKNLNLEKCILKDLTDRGVKQENINSISLCTHCSTGIKLHSYRKSHGDYGRLFSFIILN